MNVYSFFGKDVQLRIDLCNFILSLALVILKPIVLTAFQQSSPVTVETFGFKIYKASEGLKWHRLVCLATHN